MIHKIGKKVRQKAWENLVKKKEETLMFQPPFSYLQILQMFLQWKNIQKTSLFATRICIFAFVAGCQTTYIFSELEGDRRQKELDKHENIESLVLFPVTGDVDPEGEINSVVYSEVDEQLEGAIITTEIIEQILSDWGISQIFPHTLQPKLTFFHKLLSVEKPVELLKSDKVRYPGFEFSYGQKMDLRLLVRELSLSLKNLGPLKTPIASLDFDQTFRLLNTYSKEKALLSRLSQKTLNEIEPTYMMFVRIDGNKQKYEESKTQVSVSAVIVNFETGGFRSIGRIRSNTKMEENYPYELLVEELTKILITKMEKPEFDFSDALEEIKSQNQGS